MKIKTFLKKYLNKVVAAFCTANIFFTTVISCVSMAASGSPASWDDVGDDAIALRDIYFEYFINSTSGDFPGAFKTAKDIPIAWLTTLKDGVLAISPADDIYYYLKDGKLSIRSSGGGGHIRSGASSGGGYCRNCKKPAAECTCDNFDGDAEDFTPFLSGKDLKDIAADYNSRYMPMANEDQYFYHFHGDNTSSYDNSKWDFTPYCPVYIFEKQWGNKSWTDFYFIPVLSDDNKTTFYGQQYGHIFAKNVDGTTTMYFDLINMSDDSIAKSFSFVYDATTYKWIGLFFNGSLYNLYGYSSYFNYSNGYLTYPQDKEFGPFVSSVSMVSWDNSLTLGLSSLLADSTFTPKTNKNDDWGYILSNKPFELFANQTKIDFDRVPNNYIITINGDTIYDYSITNPDTGDTTDIKDYIDHDYDIPDLPDIKDPDDNSGTSGNVEVSGKIDVSGKVDVDVNVNVNSGSNGDSGSNGNAGDYIDPGTVDTNLDNYLEQVPELSKGFVDYLKDFFAWLPEKIYGLIILGLVVVVWCRLAGR